MEHSIFTDCTKENKRSIDFTGEAGYFQRRMETYSSGLLETHWREVCRRWKVRFVAVKLSKVN